MNEYIRRCLLLLLLFCFPLIPSFGFALPRDPLLVNLPEIEIMPRAEWYWVGQRMALNGVPMSIKMFTYAGSSDDVIKFYRAAWKVRGHGKIKEDRLGSRIIMGYELDGFYFTVQFDPGAAGVQGKAVVTTTPSSFKGSKKSILPIPPRSSIHSKVESLDMGRREETLSLNCRFDVPYVVDFYKSQLQGDGWKLFSASGNGQDDSAVLHFQRGSELLQLTAKVLHQNNSPQSQLLIHWIK